MSRIIFWTTSFGTNDNVNFFHSEKNICTILSEKPPFSEFCIKRATTLPIDAVHISIKLFFVYVLPLSSTPHTYDRNICFCLIYQTSNYPSLLVSHSSMDVAHSWMSSVSYKLPIFLSQTFIPHYNPFILFPIIGSLLLLISSFNTPILVMIPKTRKYWLTSWIKY